MPKPYLSVVIPAYNEAKRLPLTLLDVDRCLSAMDYSYEILIVNDGSSDNTAEVAGKMAKTVRNLKLVDNRENKGKGGAVRQGMLIAGGTIRLFMDADNATSVDHLNKMIPYFSGEGEERYDVVIGSRAHRESRLDPPEPFVRQIPGKLGNLWTQLILLPGLWDTQCGFKAFTAEAAEKIFKAGRLKGWGFDIEALALARKFGFRIKEIPVHWVHDPFSHVKASDYLKVLLETVTIRWWLWTGKYDGTPESA